MKTYHAIVLYLQYDQMVCSIFGHLPTELTIWARTKIFCQESVLNFAKVSSKFCQSQFLILPNTVVPKCQLLQSFLAKVSLRKEAKKIPRTIIQIWDYQIGRHQTKQIAWSAWLVTITITMTPKLVRVRFNDWTQRILLAYVIRDARGRSPGSVVMGGYSCSDGCGFESQKYILDGH